MQNLFLAIHLFRVPDDDGKQVSMSVSFEEIVVVVGDRGDRGWLSAWLVGWYNK